VRRTGCRGSGFRGSGFEVWSSLSNIVVVFVTKVKVMVLKV
jgi:hypothetical protein